MKIIIEMNGERHRLVKTLKSSIPCKQCSLNRICLKGRFSKARKIVLRVCCATYCGFRKIKDKETMK